MKAGPFKIDENAESVIPGSILPKRPPSKPAANKPAGGTKS
jgi:hypothetical protein